MIPGMERLGERFVAGIGTQCSRTVWYDPRGRYDTAQASGLGDFVFHKKGVSPCGKMIVLTCKQRRPPVACTVTARISVDGRLIKPPGEHCHPPGKCARAVRKNAKREQPKRTPHEKRVTARRKVPLDVASVAALSPRARTVRALRRLAVDVKPAPVSSLQELHEYIRGNVHPSYTQTKNGTRLVSIRCPDTDSVVLTTGRLLDMLLRANMVQGDAAQRVVHLDLSTYLFTIHANCDGYIGMVACVFMSSQTVEAYREIFQRLKQQLPQWKISSFMGDLNAAVRSAVVSEFPSIHLYGCFFHYVECLVRTAGNVGLGRDIRMGGSRTRNHFLSFTALPLLPPDEIKPTFHFLSKRAIGVDSRFAGLLSYIRTVWMERIRPESFSVFRSPCGTRTNNAVKSHRAMLLQKVESHTLIWDLIQAIVQNCQDTYTEYCSHHDHHASNVGCALSRVSFESAELIEESWNFYEAGEINAAQLAWRVKHRTGAACGIPPEIDTEGVAFVLDAENDDLDAGSDDYDQDEHGGDHLYSLPSSLRPK